MQKIFKIKYIVLFMVLLSVITAAAAFSVSYASWTGKGDDSLTLSAESGKWNNAKPVTEVANGVEFTYPDGSYGKIEVSPDDKKGAFSSSGSLTGTGFWIYVRPAYEGQKFKLKLNNKVLGENATDITYNGYYPTDENNKLTLHSDGTFEVDKFSNLNADGYWVFTLTFTEWNVNGEVQSRVNIELANLRTSEGNPYLNLG